MYLGYQNDKIKFYTEEELDKQLYGLQKSVYTQDEYILSDDMTEYIKKPDNYEEILAQKERDRINALSLTSADVERALYKDRGIDFDDIIELARHINEQQEQVMLANEETVDEVNSAEITDERSTDEPENTEKEVPNKIDVKALKIELKANNFYRGHPYIEQIGKLLGYTSEDLDYLFENGKLPEKEQIPE